MFKTEGEKIIADPFAEEAKFFTEVRLLNRDVQVILEGVVNQNIMGTVLHPVSCLFSFHWLPLVIFAISRYITLMLLLK